MTITNNKDSSINQFQRNKKSKIQAQSAAFLCFLVYFLMKFFTILILWNYQNILTHNFDYVIWFVFLLILNTYLMLTTGKNPGFIKNKTINEEKINLQYFEESTQLISQTNQSNLLKIEKQNLQIKLKQLEQDIFCKICNIVRPFRTKHCYSCGRCIRKFDHHCPWIGSCVGQFNHFKFIICLLAHSLQAITTFLICFKSLSFYNYFDDKQQTFSSQFGIFSVWTLLMCFYSFFAGGLFIFHLYLISSNLTTKQLMSRRRCLYLKNFKGNPFDQGFFKNLQMAIKINQSGIDWNKILQQFDQNKQKSFWQKIWSNSYYECC